MIMLSEAALSVLKIFFMGDDKGTAKRNKKLVQAFKSLRSLRQSFKGDSGRIRPGDHIGSPGLPCKDYKLCSSRNKAVFARIALQV